MRKIALLTENSREYGRELLKGIAAFAQERRNWILRLLTPSDAGFSLRRRAFSRFGGPCPPKGRKNRVKTGIFIENKGKNYCAAGIFLI